ncbi:MAG TPA: hypothetical protein VGQ02_02595 [Candidatus Limnocylindrales bacterium]|jgi:hypothetical protein|nr:hypothetical protein [Candidatus Limnocylindrales bacterium]
MVKRILLLVACAAVMLSVGVSAVAAGEITGNGKSLHPLHANSECAFSGLDDPDADSFVHTQSWGRLSKADRAFLESIGVTPGTACNGHLSPMKH